MRKITILVGIVLLIVMIVTGWQIGSSELANVQLQDDMQDIASQAGTRIGFVEPRSDEDLRRTESCGMRHQKVQEWQEYHQAAYAPKADESQP